MNVTVTFENAPFANYKQIVGRFEKREPEFRLSELSEKIHKFSKLN